jgi:ATPase family AAA domain-containing protein 2
MDQINRKYKKFRQPVIAANQIEYLFVESDPNFVRPDVEDGLIRPFEIVKDKHGTDVLRETATGKCFYNLETTTIEERLSNGFYARPSDFLRDIRSLAKDAKNFGDKERTLKANELVSNVEVDVAVLETGGNKAAEWEALYQRQLLRAKAAAEKERKRKAMQSILDRVQSDVAGNDSDSQGPVTLGEPVPGARTTARFQVMSPLSNGHGTTSASHPTSNGLLNTSRQSDVHMSGVDDETQPIAEAGEMKPPSQAADDVSAKGAGGLTQMSQKSAITSVPPGVSPSALVNDASTTKTSDPSNRSSSNWSTQATNGFHAEQFSLVEHSNSQMPDTQPVMIPASQGTSSDEPWPHSQAQGIARGIIRPGFGSNQPGSPTSSQPQSRSSGVSKAQAPSIGNLLTDGTGDDTSQSIRHSGSSSSQQQPVLHEGQVEHFLSELTDRTSGCTIEQLEQINRELMDEIWRTRHEWNRMKVLGNLTKVFNETIGDIESIQGLLQQSQARGVDL